MSYITPVEMCNEIHMIQLVEISDDGRGIFHFQWKFTSLEMEF